MDYQRNAHAANLFDGIADGYDLPAQVFSLFQYLRWRRFLVSTMNLKDGDLVLDVCTGTAGVALEMVHTNRCQVVGLDLSREMLNCSREHIRSAKKEGQVQLMAGRAEDLPFAEASFDALSFTYLLRYVDEPRATLGEMIRVLKPGGILASLEFGIPAGPLLTGPLVTGMWYAYTRGILPIATAPLSRGWRRVGSFLGPSISRFNKSYPPDQLEHIWQELGVANVRTRRLTFGGGVVMWGTKDGGAARR